MPQWDARDVVEHDEAASKQEAVGVCSQPHPPTAKQANIWITFSANGLKKPSIDHKNLKKTQKTETNISCETDGQA